MKIVAGRKRRGGKKKVKKIEDEEEENPGGSQQSTNGLSLGRFEGIAWIWDSGKQMLVHIPSDGTCWMVFDLCKIPWECLGGVD